MSASNAEIFSALGDDVRLALVRRLSAGGPASIARLSEGSGVTRQAVTKHLLVLDSAGLVQSSRQGRERLWRLNPAPLLTARQSLDEISAQWDQAITSLKAFVEDAG